VRRADREEMGECPQKELLRLTVEVRAGKPLMAPALQPDRLNKDKQKTA